MSDPNANKPGYKKTKSCLTGKNGNSGLMKY